MSTTEADTGAAPTCGDGHKDGDEACDDGNDINGGPRDLCNNDCTIYVAPTCGAPVMYTSCDEDIDLLLPPPFQFKVGSNGGAGGTPFQQCDGVNDCSDTLEAQWVVKGKSNPNDKLWFTFKTKVPEGTFGYTFDFVFCSSEWPTWVNTGYNDLLIAYQTRPDPGRPERGSAGRPVLRQRHLHPDPNDPAKGLPLTVTALDPYFFHFGRATTGNEPQLAGTGFETTPAPTGSRPRAACSRAPRSRSASSSPT
jgi:cysteine-rich repeat protein